MNENIDNLMEKVIKINLHFDDLPIIMNDTEFEIYLDRIRLVPNEVVNKLTDSIKKRFQSRVTIGKSNISKKEMENKTQTAIESFQIHVKDNNLFKLKIEHNDRFEKDLDLAYKSMRVEDELCTKIVSEITFNKNMAFSRVMDDFKLKEKRVLELSELKNKKIEEVIIYEEEKERLREKPATQAKSKKEIEMMEKLKASGSPLAMLLDMGEDTSPEIMKAINDYKAKKKDARRQLGKC